MTSPTIITVPAPLPTSVVAGQSTLDSAADLLALVEGELGHPCDDPDEFEAALFHLGLAA